MFIGTHGEALTLQTQLFGMEANFAFLKILGDDVIRICGLVRKFTQ